MRRWPGPAALLLTISHPALARNTLVASHLPVAVARSPMVVTPDREWNRLGEWPGAHAESWTINGDALDKIVFYGGIAPYRPLSREVNRRAAPLPHFSPTMLLTDIPRLFEATYRISLDTPVMQVDTVTPAVFLGHKGVRFSYRYSRSEDDVRRAGEAVATIVDRQLYLISFDAPAVFYYDRYLPAFRAIVASAAIAR